MWFWIAFTNSINYCSIPWSIASQCHCFFALFVVYNPLRILNLWVHDSSVNSINNLFAVHQQCTSLYSLPYIMCFTTSLLTTVYIRTIYVHVMRLALLCVLRPKDAVEKFTSSYVQAVVLVCSLPRYVQVSMWYN